MSKVNFKEIILDLEGVPMKPNPESDAPLYLGDVVKNALLGQLPDDKVDGQSKSHRYTLAVDIHNAMKGDGLLEVSSEDKVIMKELIAKFYGPIIVGPAFKMIENSGDENSKPVRKGK